MTSLGLYNFFEGGSFKARFWAKNQQTQSILLDFVNTLNDSASKSAKVNILCQKSFKSF